MISGLPLAFAQPLVLIALASLPLLWWLLRLIPPRPRRVTFPPVRLLFEITPKEETPARTPWWLILLRLLLTALIIIAAAGPLWNPAVGVQGGGRSLAILVDDTFTAASHWDTRLRTADELIARAEADGRGIAIVPLGDAVKAITLQDPAAARVRLRQLAPKPYSFDRSEALPALTRFLARTPGVELVWLSDGVDTGNAASFVTALERLREDRPLTVVTGGLAPALALAGADNGAGALSVKVLRANDDGAQSGLIRALDLRGLPLGEASFSFKSSERETSADLTLPVEIRNDIARLEINGERSAGAVQLLDKRWRRRTIGIVSGATAETAQPLLASTFYLSRALSPFADARIGERISPAEAVTRFLDQSVAMLILADVGNVAGPAQARLSKWVEDGGVLVRFAGPRLAASDDNTLVPVKLRRGGRTLGGSLTWEKPQALAAFSRESPFVGMTVPSDVTVSRQVLAEPEAGLFERSWATLADGTPLVTGTRRGKGLVVLFHVTADTRWSDLPLSGTFVEMLKRLVALAGTTQSGEASSSSGEGAVETLTASRLLDGFGAFTTASGNVRPVPTTYTARATADHPPGFYGQPESFLAVNTLIAADRLAPLDLSPLGARVEEYRVAEPIDLRGLTIIAALALFLLDALLVLWLAGGLARLTRRKAAASTAVILIAIMLTQSAVAQQPSRANPSQAGDEFAMQATLETKLAYVITGDAETDAVSKAGLDGLRLYLGNRTALEAGESIGLDIARDELNFFPLIYWPIVPGAPRPSAAAVARIDAYMKQGGTVLFDTRDAIMAPPGPGGETRSPGMATLREILSSLDIPELEPVAKDHVLTKTFFLLKDFPGRFNSGQLWVEAMGVENDEDETDRPRPARAGDGVSSILITSNDLAGAWAMRPDGQPMLPLVTTEPKQRDMAYRAGVNIVMYTLTGNYKADQVHVPALLERLGQ